MYILECIYLDATKRLEFDPGQRQRDFSSSLCVQTGSGGPTQTPVQWVLGVPSPRVKRGRGVPLTTHPHLVPRSSMGRKLYCLSPQAPSWRVVRLFCFTYLDKLICIRLCLKAYCNIHNRLLQYNVCCTPYILSDMS
jgi:hypothetical protein